MGVITVGVRSIASQVLMVGLTALNLGFWWSALFYPSQILNGVSDQQSHLP